MLGELDQTFRGIWRNTMFSEHYLFMSGTALHGEEKKKILGVGGEGWVSIQRAFSRTGEISILAGSLQTVDTNASVREALLLRQLPPGM